MLSLSVSQTGLKRISISRKHHDPIPNVEWWDLPIINLGSSGDDKTYFGQWMKKLNIEKEE
jgi:hypothetical protein